MKLDRSLARWAAPVAAMALLTGCGQLAPGTAATVNSASISMKQVHDLARAQCTAADEAARKGNAVNLPMSRMSQQSVGLLMDIELSRQFGVAKGIDPDPKLVDGFYSQFESGIDPLPEPARTELAEVFHDWAAGRAVLVEAGSRKTGDKPTLVNLQQLIDAGLAERQKWAKDADVHADPRFGELRNGFPTGHDGSVSRAVSDFAKKATAEQPDPSWVSGLPRGQRCG